MCKGRLHDCRLGRLCNRRLHNYGFRPVFSEGPHVFEVAGGKALLAGELVLQVPRKTVNDFGAPAFGFLAVEDQPPDVPIQREQFTIGGQNDLAISLNRRQATPKQKLRYAP